MSSKASDRSARARHKFGRAAAIAALAALALGAILALYWAPREQVDKPTQASTPSDVLIDYFRAINARDFDTANFIEAQDLEYHFWSHPGRWEDVQVLKVVPQDRASVDVLFKFKPYGVGGWDDGVPAQFSLTLKKIGGIWRVVGSGVV